MDRVEVLEGAEEFSFEGGPVGALLIHGYTGSPQGMRALGEYLAARGVSIEGIRLPGHGTTWQDLNIHTDRHWVEATEAGFDKLDAICDEVFIVALSFGASLALDFAARHPGRVAGMVTIAGFINTNDPLRHLAPVLSRIVKSVRGAGNDIADPEGREIVYDRLPTTSTYSMLRFIKRARTSLPGVKCPLLVMHSHNDHTSHPGNASIIHDETGSTDKELVWLDRSYHVLTLDYDRDEVYERTWSFIKDHADGL